MSTVGNAPRELSSFVGRAEELAALDGALLPGRALTLVGPGGCGKTRLALRLADRWAGEAWWVGLDDVAHAGDVADRIAQVLGVAVAGEGAAHALVGDLRGRDLLLVLDNCEHVLEGAADMVATLLGACAGVAVLATSRHALEVPGEQVRAVPPLSLPDALALFLERAGVDGAGSADVRVGARRVCDRLDRLPLALELAAAWTATLTPQQIADSLTDPYALLDRGARTAPFRQRTLDESMRWSHELLGDEEKALFRRLAVLEPGFDASAVALAGLGELAALRALRGLVGASLVVADTSGPAARYRMLVTIRAYAQAKLVEAGEGEVMRDAHLELYLAAVAASAPLLESDKDTWRARIGADYGNVRAAIEWGLSREDPAKGRRLAAGVAWLWHLEQRGQEGLRLLRRAVELGGDERTALQAECLLALALVADTSAPGGPGYAAALAREIADEVGAAATSRLAHSLTGVGLLGVDLDRARAEAERARHDAIEAGDAFVADASGALVGLIHLMRDEYRQAIDLLAPAAEALLARGDRGVASSALCWLATATAQVGQLEEAERLGRRAVESAAPLRELHRTGLARAALAEIQVLRGRTVDAAATLAPLDAVADGSFIPGLEWAHAHLALAVGRADEALDWLRRERAWLAGGELAAPSRLLLARALRQAGDPTGAVEILDDLLAATQGRPAIQAAALTERAHLAEDLGLGLHHEALRIRSAHGLLLACVDSLEAIAAALAETDERGVADVLVGAAARARAEHGYHGNAAPAPGGVLPDAAPAPAMDLPDAIALAQRSRGPRRRPSAGWDSLTPTEKSVVELAAQGLTNPEIAARLYISRGTVKTHLAHVYAKLGVANRTDLTRLATLRDQAH